MDIHELLDFARKKNAADIHICPHAPVLLRVARELIPVSTKPLTPEDSKRLSLELLSEEQRQRFEQNLDYDFMSADSSARYRINVAYFCGEVGAVVRILPERPRSIEELYLPNIVTHCANYTKGLVLITGSTSQGKTTTMAAMINHINCHHKKHVVTIEDPVEYLHVNKKGVVRQREVGKDTLSFHNGLRAALRQDPDVIAIGEMRDYETIKIALTAAETGVFVLSTLHIISIDKIIERLLSYAPPEEEMHLRYLLADCLQAVIHQELVATTDGGKRVACEVLVVTDAAKNVIRRRGAYLLRNVITSGKRYGMQTMVEVVESLRGQGLITEDAANGILVNYHN
ncbi:MAG: PilT/PilU family type 4a pilus ATPase [Sedimentisphaerales bacterium]|nr:PilT/PilU family type 4a pilus ATPase [Sedimentisphaerales bacterium]